MRYVSTKVLKRLESNKIRGGFNDPQKTLLVPVSFGVSSITLLHVLDQHLQARREQGRHAGYSLHVLFIDQPMSTDQECPRDLRDLLMQRYPLHVYSTILLEDCADHGADAEKSPVDKSMNLKDNFRSLPSASARTDFIDITRRQLITAFAKSHGCDTILFGDSTTRLAERTLSETAKGRGVSLPWLTTDGDSSGINCIYPLRDLLRKELASYANVVSPPLTPLIIKSPAQVSASSKDVTIDGLMTQYFESVEKDYPSIVANVVRTTGKLKPPANSEGCEKCSLCGFSIVGGTWGGEQGSAAFSQAETINGLGPDQSLCYGCKRTLNG